MEDQKKSKSGQESHEHASRKLTPQQIEQINSLLSALGEFGEIHLIVQRGVLKYINKVESQRAWDDKDS